MNAIISLIVASIDAAQIENIAARNLGLSILNTFILYCGNGHALFQALKPSPERLLNVSIRWR